MTLVSTISLVLVLLITPIIMNGGGALFTTLWIVALLIPILHFRSHILKSKKTKRSESNVSSAKQIVKNKHNTLGMQSFQNLEANVVPIITGSEQPNEKNKIEGGNKNNQKSRSLSIDDLVSDLSYLDLVAFLKKHSRDLKLIARPVLSFTHPKIVEAVEILRSMQKLPNCISEHILYISEQMNLSNAEKEALIACLKRQHWESDSAEIFAHGEVIAPMRMGVPFDYLERHQHDWLLYFTLNLPVGDQRRKVAEYVSKFFILGKGNLTMSCSDLIGVLKYDKFYQQQLF